PGGAPLVAGTATAGATPGAGPATPVPLLPGMLPPGATPSGAAAGAPAIQLPAVQAQQQSGAPGGAAAQGAPAAAQPAAPTKPAVAPPASGFITLGSTADEVMAIQGKPDRASDAQWNYGSAYVTFLNGKVTGWSNVDNKLKVRLEPAQKAKADALTLGSTMDEVASLMGTPDYLSPVQWTYGAAYLTFQDGKVNGWSNAGGKLKLTLPNAGTNPSGTFAVGSSNDEVVAVQGVPDYLASDRWMYGTSSVDFVNGRVVGWTNGGGNLRVRLVAEGTPTPKPSALLRPSVGDYFTLVNLIAPAPVRDSALPGTSIAARALGAAARNRRPTWEGGPR